MLRRHDTLQLKVHSRKIIRIILPQPCDTEKYSPSDHYPPATLNIIGYVRSADVESRLRIDHRRIAVANSPYQMVSELFLRFPRRSMSCTRHIALTVRSLAHVYQKKTLTAVEYERCALGVYHLSKMTIQRPCLYREIPVDSRKLLLQICGAEYSATTSRKPKKKKVGRTF